MLAFLYISHVTVLMKFLKTEWLLAPQSTLFWIDIIEDPVPDRYKPSCHYSVSLFGNFPDLFLLAVKF